MAMGISDYKAAGHPARLYKLPGSEYAQFEHYGDYFTIACSTTKPVDVAIELALHLSTPISTDDRRSVLLTYGSREPLPLSLIEIEKRVNESPKGILFVRLHLSDNLVITWRASQIDTSGNTFPAQAGFVGSSFHKESVVKFLEGISTFYVSKFAQKIASNMAYLHKEPEEM